MRSSAQKSQVEEQCRPEPRAKLFHSPSLFLAFREQVVPWLRTFPSVRLWVDGPMFEEDAHSLAILLSEERLSRFRIYVTHADAGGVDLARRTLLPCGLSKAQRDVYLKAGGLAQLEDYYLERGGSLVLRPDLSSAICFFQYDVKTDSSLNEFQVVLCRGVVSKLEEGARNHVLTVLRSSITALGILGFGAKESRKKLGLDRQWRELAAQTGLFKRMGQ